MTPTPDPQSPPQPAPSQLQLHGRPFLQSLVRAPLAFWRLLYMGLNLAHGLWYIPRAFPGLDEAARDAFVAMWSRRVVERLGVRVVFIGEAEARTAGRLMVCNHVSWLDIASIHAVLPQARFISKADVLHWPLVGAMVAAAGTLFIERTNKRDALRVVHQVADKVRTGGCVAVFPEGTTGMGREPLPFHANVLQAAISTGAPILPVALRWSEPGQRFSESATYVGETTMLQSMWRIATARGLTITVRVLPEIATAGTERRALGEAVRQAIAAALREA